MICILSYNILTGGTGRVDLLTKIIKSKRPDIVGLLEAIDQQVVEALAESLDMQYRLSGRAKDREGWQAAVLSLLPILHMRIHANEILTKQPLLEVSVVEPNGYHLTVFVTHLTADFSKAWIANHHRRCEIQEILRIMSSKQGTPHLLMGDFNSLAPGERLKASSFLAYVRDPTLYFRLKPSQSIVPPDLNHVLPAPLRILKPLLEFIPQSRILCKLFDTTDYMYAPRGGIDLLQKAGYIDCFRSMNPSRSGFTWPAPLPSGRVDFIFASPELAHRLISSNVAESGEGVRAEDASDHLPVFAEFIEQDNGKIT